MRFHSVCHIFVLVPVDVFLVVSGCSCGENESLWSSYGFDWVGV